MNIKQAEVNWSRYNHYKAQGMSHTDAMEKVCDGKPTVMCEGRDKGEIDNDRS